jgi:hypothetical protein
MAGAISQETGVFAGNFVIAERAFSEFRAESLNICRPIRVIGTGLRGVIV